MFELSAATVSRRCRVGLACAAGAAIVLAPALAQAHFKLVAPPSWWTQDSTGAPQKTGPCGDEAVAGQTATGIVTAFAPGEMVSVSVTATIAHPGWYRIALVEGASSTQTLTSLPDPVPMAGTNCTPAIMSNPVWSPTQPILADGLPAGSTAQTVQSGSQTFQVRIPPNATCTTERPCTLQVIMVMTDHPVNSCYYHHCADIAVDSASDGGSGSAGGNGGGVKDAAVDSATSNVGRDATASDGARADLSDGGTGGAATATGSDASAAAGGAASGTGGAATGTSGAATATSGPWVSTGGAAIASDAGAGAGNGDSSGATSAATTASSGQQNEDTSSDGGCSLGVGRPGDDGAFACALGLCVLALARRRRTET